MTEDATKPRGLDSQCCSCRCWRVKEDTAEIGECMSNQFKWHITRWYDGCKYWKSNKEPA